MAFIAVVAGIIVAYYLSRGMLLDYLFLLYYHRRRILQNDYLLLYDVLANKFNYDLLKPLNIGPKTYLEFLQYHDKVRPFAEDIFKKQYYSILKRMGIIYVCAVLLPTLIFRSDWYFFLGSFLIVIGAFLYDMRYVKDRGVLFFATLMQIIIIGEYQDTHPDLKKLKTIK